MDSGRNSPVSLSRSSSLRASMSNRTSLVRRNQSMSAKQVRFFRNGDRYFNGLKLAVSAERYKEFDSLLAELSKKLDLPTGAVRYIFNADDSSIISDVTQLQYGVPYVCSSLNSFRQIEGGYGKHMHNWSIITKPSKLEKNLSYSKPNILNHSEMIAQYNSIRHESARDFIKPKLVTVIRNGKPPQKKVTLLLNSKTAISLDQVLDQLSARGSLGKVDKLYTVDSRVVKSLKDLFDDDTVFIALHANEKFPEDGIELDPDSYRITPYRELKRPSSMTVKRSHSLRHSVRKYKDENENMSSMMSKSLRQNGTPINKVGNTKVARPKSSPMKQSEQSRDELYPTSVFESDSSDSENPCEVTSMFGIKRDKLSVHSSYKIGRVIGDGNFAIVRECRNRKTQKSFALKVINKAKVKGKEHMIENEIVILRKISHPNIVKLHDEYETSKEIFLVMELIAGGDLFDAIVANTRFCEADSAFMVRDLSTAVKYLHDKDIVHRDIKPENLLVVHRSDGRKAIKLADFGLSIEVDGPIYLVCGTPTYVAPEILDESGYGLKVDSWAIGVICYILLCGFPPFRSSNHDQEELFEKIMHGEFEYLAPFWDDVSDGPRDLIDRLLVVDASERYEAFEVVEHFWIQKWTKSHQPFTEVEDLNKNNRKRFRGVALAVQAVISLLHHVRAKRSLNESLNGLQLEAKVMNKSPPPLTISRIPLPKPLVGHHIASIRRSMVMHPPRKPAVPDCSFNKGHFKREEVIQRPSRRLNHKPDLKTTAIPSPIPQRKVRKLKSRPVSVFDIRVPLSSSIGVEKQDSDSSEATTSPRRKPMIKRQRKPRPRPHSMIETINTTLEVDELSLEELKDSDIHVKYDAAKQQSDRNDDSKVRSSKAPYRKAHTRPTSLVLKEAKNSTSPRLMSIVIRENEAKSDYEKFTSSSPLHKPSPVKAYIHSPVKPHKPLSKCPSTPVTTVRKSSKYSYSPNSSPKKTLNRFLSVNDVTKTPEKKPLPHWNYSTKPKKVAPPSARRSSMNNASGICITTQKIKNVIFPDGKTVDRETKTTTTVSLGGAGRSPHEESLLRRVKDLAQEIECLSNNNISDSSSDSINQNTSDETYTCNKPETDHFSETEYLSVANQNE